MVYSGYPESRLNRTFLPMSRVFLLFHKQIRVLSWPVTLIIPSGEYTEVAEGAGMDAEKQFRWPWMALKVRQDWS